MKLCQKYASELGWFTSTLKIIVVGGSRFDANKSVEINSSGVMYLLGVTFDSSNVPRSILTALFIYLLKFKVYVAYFVINDKRRNTLVVFLQKGCYAKKTDVFCSCCILKHFIRSCAVILLKS